MDFASVIGLVAALCLMIFGMVNGNGFGVIKDSFMDAPSALITFGGAFGTVLAMYPLGDFLSGLKSFLYIFKIPKTNEVETIKSISWNSVVIPLKYNSIEAPNAHSTFSLLK